MADEDLAIASPALETASGETQNAETNTNDASVEAGSPDEVELDIDGLDDDAEDEDDDLDFGFKKYRVPKSLKKAVEDMRADHTRKTQDASARQKALDQRERDIQERFSATDEELNDRAELRRLDSTIAEYAKLTPQDWAAHSSSDPLGTENHWKTYQLLKDQKAEVAARLDKVGKERTEKAQSELTKRIQETLEHAKKSKGFSEKTIPQVVEFAQSMGVPDSVIQSNWSPVMFDLMRFARIGKMALDKQAAPKPAADVPANPTPIVTGRKVTPSKPSDRMSTQNWIAARNKQLAAK